MRATSHPRQKRASAAGEQAATLEQLDAKAAPAGQAAQLTQRSPTACRPAPARPGAAEESGHPTPPPGLGVRKRHGN